MALSLPGVTSPVLNWEALVQGHWYGGVPERGVQLCIPAPQRVRLGLILLGQAFPAGSHSCVGMKPLSPPGDTARPCPACSGTSGNPRGLDLLGGFHGKPLPGNPTSCVRSYPAFWGLLGWEGAVGPGWEVAGPWQVGDVVLGMIQSSGQPLAAQSRLSQWKESVGITPGWDTAGRRGRARPDVSIPVCHQWGR